jgi:hypothetical protein
MCDTVCLAKAPPVTTPMAGAAGRRLRRVVASQLCGSSVAALMYPVLTWGACGR